MLGNILSLRNNLSMSSDVAEVTEVSQEKLLSLVAERLIDSNSNVDVTALLSCYKYIIVEIIRLEELLSFKLTITLFSSIHSIFN